MVRVRRWVHARRVCTPGNESRAAIGASDAVSSGSEALCDSRAATRRMRPCPRTQGNKIAFFLKPPPLLGV